MFASVLVAAKACSTGFPGPHWAPACLWAPITSPIVPLLSTPSQKFECKIVKLRLVFAGHLSWWQEETWLAPLDLVFTSSPRIAGAQHSIFNCVSCHRGNWQGCAHICIGRDDQLSSLVHLVRGTVSHYAHFLGHFVRRWQCAFWAHTPLFIGSRHTLYLQSNRKKGLEGKLQLRPAGVKRCRELFSFVFTVSLLVSRARWSGSSILNTY